MKKEINFIRDTLPGLTARIVGFMLEFLTFTFLNGLIFYAFWVQPNFLFKIIYFVLLFFVMNLQLRMNKWFISKYIDSMEIMTVIFQRRTVKFYTFFYLIAYLSANLSRENSDFQSYLSTCLIAYFITWLIYIKKVKSLVKLVREEREQNKKGTETQV